MFRLGVAELEDPAYAELRIGGATSHAEQVVGWVRRFRNVEDWAKAVSTEAIERADWTLNIFRYVLPTIGEDVPPLPEAVAASKQALAEARAAEDACGACWKKTAAWR